jgi:hypothetical protein
VKQLASNTPNLGLHKKDPITDGNQTFNIQTMLNDNWDKIDLFAKEIEQQLADMGNVDEVVNNLIQQIGDLPNLSTENKLNLVAAVNEVYQKIVTHSADKANPHGVTKSQVGLGNVDNVKQIPLSEKGQPNGVAALDANGNVLNGNGNISGGGSQTGEFTDTTTVIQANALYTKRIPLNGNPKAGRIRQIRNVGEQYGSAFFTTKREQTTGFIITNGSGTNTYIGFNGDTYGIFGQAISNNIRLNGVWIDEDTNELVLEFINGNASSPATMNIARTGSGTSITTGLIWEVY